MKNLNKILASIGFIVIIAIIYLSGVRNRSENYALGIDNPAISAMSTSTFKVIGTSSTLIVSTSTCTQFVEIVNDSPKTIYLSLAGDAPAVLGRGIMLSASSTYRISQANGNLYAGAIRGISDASANTTLTCQ